jgi:hypothetical protein
LPWPTGQRSHRMVAATASERESAADSFHSRPHSCAILTSGYLADTISGRYRSWPVSRVIVAAKEDESLDNSPRLKGDSCFIEACRGVPGRDGPVPVLAPLHRLTPRAPRPICSVQPSRRGHGRCRIAGTSSPAYQAKERRAHVHSRSTACKRELLSGSPSGAFAFGISASPVEVQAAGSAGPSHAARPPAERRQRALRWHPAADLSPAGPAGPGARSTGHPFGWRERGARLPSACGRLACAQASTAVLHVPGDRPCIPWLKPRGVLAPGL